MKLDDTIQRVIDKISVGVSDDFDIDLSDDKLLDIINSQFRDFPTFTKEEKTIKLDYFGKFKIKDKRKEVVTQGRLNSIIMYLENVQLLEGYRYIIEDREEVDYDSIVKFIFSQLKMNIDINDIIEKIKVVIDDKRVPLKHLTND